MVEWAVSMLARDEASDYLESSFREKLLEHVFVSELLQEAWLGRGQTMEVLRSEVDSAGYDLVLDCGGITRYVQLKGSKVKATTSRQTVNVKLADKPGGCIVWLRYEEKPEVHRMELQYLFFGGAPEQPRLPSLSEFKIGRHTRGNKAERPSTRVIPKSQFEPISSIGDLMNRLFGPGPQREEKTT